MTLNVDGDCDRYGRERMALIHCGWAHTFEIRIPEYAGGWYLATPELDYHAVKRTKKSNPNSAYSRHGDTIYVSANSLDSARQMANLVAKIARSIFKQAETRLLTGTMKTIEGIRVARDKRARRLFDEDVSEAIAYLAGDHLCQIHLPWVESWRYATPVMTQEWLPGEWLNNRDGFKRVEVQKGDFLLRCVLAGYTRHGIFERDASKMFFRGVHPSQAKAAYAAMLLSGRTVEEMCECI